MGARRRRCEITTCAICSRLKDTETSFEKYLAPDYDRPLPEAAAQLVVLLLGEVDPERTHVRRCPLCGTLYEYLRSHEYMINGTEEEETLVRLQPSQATELHLVQARRLEGLRREIDDLQWAAGSLGDYIDRGRPSPEKEKGAYEAMQEHAQNARQARTRLAAQVQALRKDCPEILSTWAEAHIRVCRFFLDTLPATGDDAQTARYVAKSTMEAWQQLPHDGETFVTANTSWLEGYLERLDRELGPASVGAGSTQP